MARLIMKKSVLPCVLLIPGSNKHLVLRLRRFPSRTRRDTPRLRCSQAKENSAGVLSRDS